MTYIKELAYDLFWPAVAFALLLVALSGCASAPGSWNPQDYLVESRERVLASAYGELLDPDRPLPTLVLDAKAERLGGSGAWAISAYYDRIAHEIHVTDPSPCATGATVLPGLYDCTWNVQDAIDHEMMHALARSGTPLDVEEYWARRATGTFPAVSPQPVYPGAPL